MGSMTSPASVSLKEIVAHLDQRIQTVDEERWLSSRYAPDEARQALIILYAFYYELARVRVVVTDQTMGQIRYQWWRDALEELGLEDCRWTPCYDCGACTGYGIEHVVASATPPAGGSQGTGVDLSTA